MPKTHPRERGSGQYTDRPAQLPRGTPFTLSSIIYLVAALVVATLNFRAPFTRGWWLVAYLSLVGGIAQLLLGPGLLAISRRIPTATSAWNPGSLKAELILWNTGTLIVAVASMVRIPIGVPTGSILLFAALAHFTAKERAARKAAETTETRSGWLPAYTTLRWFMALSVVVGNILAYRGYR